MSSLHRVSRRGLLATLSAIALLGCNSANPTAPDLPDDADLRILFIGNSLTYYNDMPGLVETIAAHQGYSVATAVAALPNYALEDHWNNGIASVIRSLAPDVVVMQQGPSSLPQNQEHLKEWTETLNGVISGLSRPALMMVWPELNRIHAFDAVRDAYHNAALAVDGDFIPVGEVFRALLSIPGLSPLGPDGFHPSHLGSVAAAATVLRYYHEHVLVDLPGRIDPPTGTTLPLVSLSDEQARVVWKAVEEVVTEWGDAGSSNQAR